jgi:hypothetical protein
MPGDDDEKKKKKGKEVGVVTIPEDKTDDVKVQPGKVPKHIDVVADQRSQAVNAAIGGAVASESKIVAGQDTTTNMAINRQIEDDLQNAARLATSGGDVDVKVAAPDLSYTALDPLKGYTDPFPIQTTLQTALKWEVAGDVVDPFILSWVDPSAHGLVYDTTSAIGDFEARIKSVIKVAEKPMAMFRLEQLTHEFELENVVYADLGGDQSFWSVHQRLHQMGRTNLITPSILAQQLDRQAGYTDFDFERKNKMYSYTLMGLPEEAELYGDWSRHMNQFVGVSSQDIYEVYQGFYKLQHGMILPPDPTRVEQESARTSINVVIPPTNTLDFLAKRFPSLAHKVRDLIWSSLNVEMQLDFKVSATIAEQFRQATTNNIMTLSVAAQLSAAMVRTNPSNIINAYFQSFTFYGIEFEVGVPSKEDPITWFLSCLFLKMYTLPWMWTRRARTVINNILFYSFFRMFALPTDFSVLTTRRWQTGAVDLYGQYAGRLPPGMAHHFQRLMSVLDPMDGWMTQDMAIQQDAKPAGASNFIPPSGMTVWSVLFPVIDITDAPLDDDVVLPFYDAITNLLADIQVPRSTTFGRNNSQNALMLLQIIWGRSRESHSRMIKAMSATEANLINNGLLLQPDPARVNDDVYELDGLHHHSIVILDIVDALGFSIISEVSRPRQATEIMARRYCPMIDEIDKSFCMLSIFYRMYLNDDTLPKNIYTKTRVLRFLLSVIPQDRFGIFAGLLDRKMEDLKGNRYEADKFSSLSQEVKAADLTLYRVDQSRWSDVIQLSERFYDSMRKYAVLERFYMYRGDRLPGSMGRLKNVNVYDVDPIAQTFTRETLIEYMSTADRATQLHEAMADGAVIEMDMQSTFKLEEIKIGGESDRFFVVPEGQRALQITKYLSAPGAAVTLTFPEEGSSMYPQMSGVVIRYRVPKITDPPQNSISDYSVVQPDGVLISPDAFPLSEDEMNSFLVKYAFSLLSHKEGYFTVNGLPKLLIATTSAE